MSKKMFRAVIAGLLLFAAPQVAADNCCAPSCDPCWDPCDCCGDWEVGVHALLFQPLTCRWDFAKRIDEVNGDSFSTVATIDPSLDWGFRVWGKYIQDCTFISVGYQWFEANDCATLEGDNVGTRGNGFAGTEAFGKLSWRYQNVDVRVGGLKRSCKGEVYGFLNGRWVDLEYKRQHELDGFIIGDFNAELFAAEKACFSGGAIGLGLGGRRDIFCDVGIFGELNLLGVIGSHDTRAEFVLEQGLGSISLVNVSRPSYRSITTISPEVDFRIGLDYTWCCDCWTIVAEVGYELDYFWNVFDFPEELSGDLATGDDEWITHCEDVGFSGLFFGLRFLF